MKNVLIYVFKVLIRRFQASRIRLALRSVLIITNNAVRLLCWQVTDACWIVCTLIQPKLFPNIFKTISILNKLSVHNPYQNIQVCPLNGENTMRKSLLIERRLDSGPNYKTVVKKRTTLPTENGFPRKRPVSRSKSPAWGSNPYSPLSRKNVAFRWVSEDRQRRRRDGVPNDKNARRRKTF